MAPPAPGLPVPPTPTRPPGRAGRAPGRRQGAWLPQASSSSRFFIFRYVQRGVIRLPEPDSELRRLGARRSFGGKFPPALDLKEGLVLVLALVANRRLQIRAMRLTPQPKPAPPLPTAAAASSAYQARYLRFMGLLRVRTRSLISRLQLLATSELQADAPVANLSVHPSAEVYQGAHVS